jgi:hypothetical protein
MPVHTVRRRASVLALAAMAMLASSDPSDTVGRGWEVGSCA